MGTEQINAALNQMVSRVQSNSQDHPEPDIR
jgi:hypothetical protein